jgi:hypothetical protein
MESADSWKSLLCISLKFLITWCYSSEHHHVLFKCTSVVPLFTHSLICQLYLSVYLSQLYDNFSIKLFEISTVQSPISYKYTITLWTCWTV